MKIFLAPQEKVEMTPLIKEPQITRILLYDHAEMKVYN